MIGEQRPVPMITRRGLLRGLGGFIASAPAIVRVRLRAQKLLRATVHVIYLPDCVRTLEILPRHGPSVSPTETRAVLEMNVLGHK